MGKIDKSELSKFGNLELLAKQVVEGFITGLHKSPFHGFSVEFAEHRLYNSGESTRHVDWKLYARTQKLFTKKYEEETNLRCQIMLDCSSSMYFQFQPEKLSKIQYAIYAIASLIELLKKQRDAVGLSFFTNELNFHSECKTSVSHHHFLYAELEKQLQRYDEKSSTTTVSAQALHDVAELTHKRSLILLFSDMLEDEAQLQKTIEGLQHMKHNKHEVVLFHVIDKEIELDFDFQNRPYQFVDMETGERMKLSPNQIKEKYQNAIQSYFKKVESECLKNRIDFVTLDINQPLTDVLLKYLTKRQKMI
jgi:uncharacterized protein (DUF58 family)